MVKKEACKKELYLPMPEWFYYASIAATFMFNIYLSIYATIHFGDLRYMNNVLVFMFIAFVSFFLISAVYFQSEKMGFHTFSPALFFIGIVALVFYAFKAPDTLNLVRYSTIYTILVTGISLFILIPKRGAGK